jgi:hypothetical protein
MNSRVLKSALLPWLFFIARQIGVSQSFINLDFESAKVISDPTGAYYPYSIAITNALPGWSVFGTTQGDITYNDPALGSCAVTLWATNGLQISGKYSVLLQGGIGPEAYISQTGLVPTGTESLLFEAAPLSGVAVLSALEVSLGGQEIPYYALFTGPNYTLYGGNIPSALAGEVDQLTFTCPGGGVEGTANNWTIDNIQFSASQVPEPQVLGLTALGGLLFLRAHRRIASR